MFISLFSCSKNEKIPADVLGPPKMVSILADIHELETMVGSLKLTYDSSTVLYKQQQSLIFEKHQVSDSVYLKSFDYYLQHVEVLDQIYAAVVDSLSLRRNMGTRKEETEPDEAI